MKIWLDDTRPEPTGWLRARNANDAIIMFKFWRGAVDEISFDHDLGPASAGTGYDVACWIEQEAVAGNMNVPRWTIHSANPVGRDRIAAAMHSAERHVTAALLRELELTEEQPRDP